MSPIFRHGRLRLYLLKLLDEAPRHGYEVIRLLQDRFMGVYSPSPGTIYPRLARLEEDGLVTHDEVDGRKVYRITDKGREEIQARLDDLAELEEELTESVRDIAREVSEDVRDTVRSLREEITWAARDFRREGEPGRRRRSSETPQDADQRPGAEDDAGETGVDEPGADERSRSRADDARIRDEARRVREDIRGSFRAQRRGRPGASRDDSDRGADRRGADRRGADRRGADRGADRRGADRRGAEQTGEDKGSSDKSGPGQGGRSKAGAGRGFGDDWGGWADRAAAWQAWSDRGQDRGPGGGRPGGPGGGRLGGGGLGGGGLGGGRPGGGRPGGGWGGWQDLAGGMPAGLERLASDFARELRSAAGHADDIREGALGDLRDILADTLARIRDEVFTGDPRTGAEPADESSAARTPADEAAAAGGDDAEAGSADARPGEPGATETKGDTDAQGSRADSD